MNEMARRSQLSDPEMLRTRLMELLRDLPHRLAHGSVGEQVGDLVQVHHLLRDLGSSIGAALAPGDSDSGRARLIAYFRAQIGRIVHTDELMIVAGIGDYPRRIRELRGDHGWPIISGLAVRDLRLLSASPYALKKVPAGIAPDEYLLLEDRQDHAAPGRWTAIKEMRDPTSAARTLVREYFERFPGHRITAEELRYLVSSKSDWTSAVRDLAASGRTIEGADLEGTDSPPGIFVLKD
ncbi:hypothetical protein [uncultured Sphingomonas sp.]|uniref:hypothetical protein n=1 Tax=uncultured Sphingomonas sp. TaxID=158754 RepID=UPI0025E0B775|nr:hypothetical protein [uncultured Sphingomonas sp.]